MTDQVSTLGLAVDTSSVKSAAIDLDAFAAKGEGASSAASTLEKVMREITPTTQSLAKQFEILATEAGRANAASQLLAIAQQGQQQAAKSLFDAQRNFVTSLQAEVDAMGKSRAELLLMKAAQLGVAEQAAPLISKLTQTTDSYNATGKSAAQLAQQHQIAAVQVKDFVEQIIAGGSPLRAFAQQGAAVVSNYGGAGKTLEALSGILTGARLAALGTAGAVTALGVAYYNGQKELEDFQKTLIFSGSQAGVTADQLQGLAHAIREIGDATQGRASEVLASLASSSAIGADHLLQIADAAIKLERAGGAAAEQTVQAFKDLGKEPVDAALRLNEAVNFLTPSIYAQIRALQDQGKTLDAAKIAQDAYGRSVNEQTEQLEHNLGYLQRAWRGAGEEAKRAWDAMLDVGRDHPVEKAIGDAASALDYFGRMTSGAAPAGLTPYLGIGAADMSAQAALQKAAEQIAKDKGLARIATEAMANLDRTSAQYLPRQIQLEQELAKVRESAAKALTAPNLDDKTRTKIQAMLATAEKGLTDTFDPGKDEAQIQSRLSAVQRQLTQSSAAYSVWQQQIETEHQAGLLDDAQYYDARRGLIEADRQIQTASLQAQVNALRASDKDAKLTTAEHIANADKISDAIAQMDIVTRKAAADQKNLNLDQQKSINGVAAAYLSAKMQAEDYVSVLDRANQRSLAGLGQGNEFRSNSQARGQIEDKYTDDLRRAQESFATLRASQGNVILKNQQDDFDKQIALIEEFRKKALGNYDDYYADLKKKQADWRTGAAEALNNYLDDQRNIAKQVEGAYTDAFSGMEDALANFVKTGKLNFSSLVDTILTDIARIEAKQLVASAATSSWGSSLLSLFGSALGGAAGGTTTGESTGGTGVSLSWPTGKRAIGGPVSANSTYEVNERDVPEIATVNGRQYLTTGDQGGKITPLSDAGLGGVHNTFNIGAGVQRGEIAALIPELERRIKASVMQSLTRPGSPIGRS